MSADGATDPIVIAFGELIDLDEPTRRMALDELRQRNPLLAESVARLLAHAGARTRILTSFASDESIAARTPRTFAAGETIGGFTLLERIGRGGMGEVWRARQAQPARDVALKLIHTSEGSPSTRIAALREPETLATLRHPSIATIHASGSDGSVTWIAMEFIADASPITDATRTLALRERIAILLAAADAVAHAHAAGFIHRDLKPSNILVDAAGRVKVIDFGIALPSATSIVADPRGACGTPAYIAPEALDPTTTQVDAHADVRALGVLLYEIVHGTLPAALCTEHPLELLRALRDERFAPPADAPRETRGDLSAIITRATAADPAARYATVAAFADDLRAYLAHRPVNAARPGAVARLRLAARRNPIAATLTAATFIALVAATGISTYYALYARQAAIEAGELARKTGETYSAFLDIFLPGDMSKPEIRSMTVEEYLRTRVANLERLAAKSMPHDQLHTKPGVAQTLQYACLSLGLAAEAERCAIAREIIETRAADPKGAIVGNRHLEALYARLARDPGDQAARTAIDTVIPEIIRQPAIIRAAPLSQIGSVDYYGDALMSAQVAQLLVQAAPRDPEVLLAALSRLAVAAHKSAEQGERLSAAHLANLHECVRLFREVAALPDSALRRQAQSLASGANMLFSSKLAIARTPELAPILIELSLIEDELRPRRTPAEACCTQLHYFDVMPMRLALAHEWDACAAALDALDLVVRERNLTLDPADIRNLALARAELAIHRASPTQPGAARAEALAILGAALAADPAAEDPYNAHSSFAAAIDRHATLAAELGLRDELLADLDRVNRFLGSITDNRVPRESLLQVGERIGMLLAALEH